MAESRFVQRRRVEFSETDLAGIMHFSNFFRLMESTEHAFYRSLGFSVHDFRMGEGGKTIGWPRVHAEASYHQPLRFEDEVDVELLVRDIGAKSIRYEFRFWRGGAGQGLAANGFLKAVCVEFHEGELRAIPIPNAIRERLEESLVE